MRYTTPRKRISKDEESATHLYSRIQAKAVWFVQCSGKPIAQVARELGISVSSIHQWRKELAAYEDEAFRGTDTRPRRREELQRLKRELEVTRQERDMVQKRSLCFREQKEELAVYSSPQAGSMP